MSVKPRIFISSVSRELASTRQIVANTLLFLNYEPVWQDIIGVEQGEIRDILRRQIDSCVGLIQLTGQRYGLEPSEPDPEFGRVSYTQYEALYAVRRGMKVWHFLLDENFTPDQPNDEPEELRKLQQDYRKKIEQSDRLWHAMPNASELEKTLLKFRNDLEELRVAAERERRNGIRWRAALAAAVLLLAGGLWWVKTRTDEKSEIVEKKVEANTTVVREQTAQVVSKIDDLAKLFEEASKHDGIIANPQTPADHYHNARFAEVKSDFAMARKSYNAFLASGVEYIDPYVAYADMLKVQEGGDGAREVLTALRKSNSTLSLEAVSALLLPKAQRIETLRALAEKAPDFSPTAYLLSREFSAEKLGDQTIADKNEEKKWLDAFRGLNTAGKFQKYILDKKEGQKWLSDVDARAAKLAAMPESVLKNPVSLTAMQSNDGWMMTFGFADYKIKKVEWRYEGDADFKDTGVSTIVNPQTGMPMPNMSVPLGKLKAGTYSMEVRYVDITDKTNGPFKVSFNTEDVTLAFGKQVLGSLMNSWVRLREYDGKLLCYFTSLLSYRSSLKSIRYSVDSEALDKTFAFSPPKPGQSPYEINTDETIYLTLPLTTKSVTVQLEYADGTLSEKKTFTDRSNQ